MPEVLISSLGSSLSLIYAFLKLSRVRKCERSGRDLTSTTSLGFEFVWPPDHRFWRPRGLQLQEKLFELEAASDQIRLVADARQLVA